MGEAHKMLKCLIQKEEKENRKEGGISMKWVEQLAAGMRSKRARGCLDRSVAILPAVSSYPMANKKASKKLELYSKVNLNHCTAFHPSSISVQLSPMTVW